MYEIDLELYTLSLIQMNSAFEKLESDEFDNEGNALLRESMDNFRSVYQTALIDLSLSEINYGEYDHFFMNVKPTFPRYVKSIKGYMETLENKDLKSDLNELLDIFDKLIKIADIYFKKRGFE